MRSLLLLTATLLVTIGGGPARAAAPSTRPTVPALIVGGGPPKSFLVNGVFRFSDAGGVAFDVACDGERQRCAVYDPADGTPLFISDGQQSLIYDLASSRILRVPVSRGNVRIDWDAKEEKSLGFNFAVECRPKPVQLDDANSWFRIDRFVDSAPNLRRLSVKENVELFAAERRGGYVESLQLDPHDASRFRFTSMLSGEGFYRLEIAATRIGERLPAAALAFPEVSRLPEAIHLVDADPQKQPELRVFLQGGVATMAKFALAGGRDVRASVEKALPNADWDELRKRDASYGAAYRKALSEQGLRFRTYSRPAATQPNG